MQSRQSLELRQHQQLALTPQLQQSIRFLQLSAHELELEVAQALLDNPLLEREEEYDTDGRDTVADDEQAQDDRQMTPGMPGTTGGAGPDDEPNSPETTLVHPLQDPPLQHFPPTRPRAP